VIRNGRLPSGGVGVAITIAVTAGAAIASGIACCPAIRDSILGIGAAIGADNAVDADERQQGHQRDPGNPFQHGRSITYRLSGTAGVRRRPIRSRHATASPLG